MSARAVGVRALLQLLLASLLQAAASPAAALPGWISRDLNGDNETFGCAVAAGLLNRHYGRPAAVMQHKFGATTFGNHDAEWLKVINRTNATVQATEFTPVNAAGMLAAAAKSGAAAGAVLYNVSDLRALPTVLTLCGVHRAVPVRTLSEAAALGLPVVFDARERWATSLEATQFAIRELLPRCSKKLFVLQEPHDLLGGDLTDVAVGVEPPLFTIWPEDPYPVPASGPDKGKTFPSGPASICELGSPTHELFANLTEGEIGRQHGWLGPGLPDRRLVSAMGYHDSGPPGALTECIALCTPAHRTVSLVGSFGGFHAQLPPVDTIKQKSPVLDPGRFDAARTYVALINSDGDNMGIDNNQLTQSTGLAERVRVCAAPGALCPPIGWTMSNRLAEWAPAILRWYYENATPSDSFLMGPSGYGYVYPALMDAADQETFADATTDAAKRFDMHGYTHWDWLGSWSKALPFLKMMASRISEGGPEVAFVAEVPDAGTPHLPSALIGDGPAAHKLAVAKQLTSQWEASDYHGLQGTHGNRTKRLGITDPKELAKKLIALPPGSIGYVYKIWSVNFTSVEDLAVELKGTHVQLVDHRALKGLIVQKEAVLGLVNE